MAFVHQQQQFPLAQFFPLAEDNDDDKQAQQQHSLFALSNRRRRHRHSNNNNIIAFPFSSSSSIVGIAASASPTAPVGIGNNSRRKNNNKFCSPPAAQQCNKSHHQHMMMQPNLHSHWYRHRRSANGASTLTPLVLGIKTTKAKSSTTTIGRCFGRRRPTGGFPTIPSPSLASFLLLILLIGTFASGSSSSSVPVEGIREQNADYHNSAGHDGGINSREATNYYNNNLLDVQHQNGGANGANNDGDDNGNDVDDADNANIHLVPSSVGPAADNNRIGQEGGLHDDDGNAAKEAEVPLLFLSSAEQQLDDYSSFTFLMLRKKKEMKEEEEQKEEMDKRQMQPRGSNSRAGGGLMMMKHFEKKDIASLPSLNLDTLAGIGLGKRSGTKSLSSFAAFPWRFRTVGGGAGSTRNGSGAGTIVGGVGGRGRSSSVPAATMAFFNNLDTLAGIGLGK